MNRIKIATAQFENKSGKKSYNLGVIASLTEKAAQEGARVIAFHECSVTGYSFAHHLSKEQLLSYAEILPDDESIQKLTSIAREQDMVILAGLFEKDEADHLYNTYVCVDKKGLVASYRKLHPFIHPGLSPGNGYCIFDLYGWKCGISICYDNNIIENVRANKSISLLFPFLAIVPKKIIFLQPTS